MLNKNIIKAIGIMATFIGFGATFLKSWVDEREMDAKIEEKVNEALANRQEENMEES